MFCICPRGELPLWDTQKCFAKRSKHLSSLYFPPSALWILLSLLFLTFLRFKTAAPGTGLGVSTYCHWKIILYGRINFLCLEHFVVLFLFISITYVPLLYFFFSPVSSFNHSLTPNQLYSQTLSLHLKFAYFQNSSTSICSSLTGFVTLQQLSMVMARQYGMMAKNSPCLLKTEYWAYTQQCFGVYGTSPGWWCLVGLWNGGSWMAFCLDYPMFPVKVDASFQILEGLGKMLAVSTIFSFSFVGSKCIQQQTSTRTSFWCFAHALG